MRHGDLAARDELVVRNLPLGRYFANRYRRSGVPHDDLVSAAYGAMVTAADRFDARVARYGTYASWWINRALKTLVADDRLVRLPMKKAVAAPPESTVSFSRTPEDAETTRVPEDVFGTAPEQGRWSQVADLRALMGTALTEQEATIIRRRFRDDETLKAIGETLGLSRERIRQIEKGAIAKLKKALVVAA